MKLRYTLDAATELAEVLDGIAAHSPQGARRVQSRIRKAINLLIDHPYSGPLTSRRTVRRIVVTPYPYLVFYRVAEGEVIIIGVRHGARNPSSMPGTV